METRERDRSSSTQRQHSHMFQVLLFGSSRCLLWLYNRSTTSPLICCYGSIPAGVEQVLSASSGDSVSVQSEEIRLFSLSVTESLSDRRHSESPSSNVNGYSRVPGVRPALLNNQCKINMKFLLTLTEG